MQKLTPADPDTKSPDLIAENLDQLKVLFPEAFTEGKVDFDVLRELMGDAVDEREEKYGLNWHGKRQARRLAVTPSTGTLRPCPEESVDWDTTKNIFIEGDNLEVLKLLQKSYSGKVKLIYIDPPYNTGKDFVYPDNYQDNIRNYLELTGQVDSEGRKLAANTEASGRFHTDWLNMMYPRLKLARNLLREDGVIFISIDDNEMDNLRLVCDEVFGEENFIVSIFWEKGRKNDAKLFSVGHDYMLVYAKSKGWLTENKIRWREAKPGAAEIQDEYLRLKAIHGHDVEQIQRDLRQLYAGLSKTNPSKKLTRYSNVDEHGVWRDDNMSWPGGGGPMYDVIHPDTKQPCKVPEGGWRYSTIQKMNEMIDAGRVLFRADHTEPPIRKTYLVRKEVGSEDDDEAGEDVGIQVAGSYFYRSALQASNLMLDLFGSKVFDSPQDHEVLARWIRYTSASSEDAIVLDFFAGSGTTGHAVMAENALGSAESHRYVLVQLPEPLDASNREQKVAANYCEELGCPLNIAELTKERLRRSGEKILRECEERSAENAGEQDLFDSERIAITPPDIGFRVFKLDTSNIREWRATHEAVEDDLLAHVDNLDDRRTETDILYELLLKLGLDLCVPIEQRTIAGKTVHSIGGGVLLACLAQRINRADVEELGQVILAWHKELGNATDTRAVFRDSAFADDVAKTNLSAILQQGGITDVRSL